MNRSTCKIYRIKDNQILFGKKNQNTSFIYRQKDDKSMEFSHVCNVEMESYYQYIDSKFVDIIQSCLLWIYEKGEASFEECSAFLIEQNPLQLETDFAQRFYPNIMTKFASYVSLHSEKDHKDAKERYSLVEIQHGKAFVKHYPVHLSFPYVLMPYCTLSVKKINGESDDATTIRLKPIVKYKDKTAPTKLGYELSEIQNELSVNSDIVYERVSKMAIRLYDKYQEQLNYFGKDTIDMVNRQVY